MDEKKRKMVMAGVAGGAGLLAVVMLYMNFFAGPKPALKPEVEEAAQQTVAELNKAQEEMAAKEPVEPEVDTTQPDETSDVVHGRLRKLK